MEIAVYSTASTAAAQRAAEWSRVIADTYFPLQLTYRDPGSFSGELERRQMGQVSLSRLATAPMQYERHARDIAHNNPEEYLVTVPRRGPVDFSQMGREVRCAPGGLILERGDEPYRFSYTQPNELCVLKVSRPMLLERLCDPDRFCAQAIDARSGLSALLVSMMGHLQALSAANPTPPMCWGARSSRCWRWRWTSVPAPRMRAQCRRCAPATCAGPSG